MKTFNVAILAFAALTQAVPAPAPTPAPTPQGLPILGGSLPNKNSVGDSLLNGLQIDQVGDDLLSDAGGLSDQVDSAAGALGNEAQDVADQIETAAVTIGGDIQTDAQSFENQIQTVGDDVRMDAPFVVDQVQTAASNVQSEAQSIASRVASPFDAEASGAMDFDSLARDVSAYASITREAGYKINSITSVLATATGEAMMSLQTELSMASEVLASARTRAYEAAASATAYAQMM